MSKVHNQVDQTPAEKKESAWWEKWLFWPLALGLSSFFIYLEINFEGGTTGFLFAASSFIFMALLVVGPIALLILLLKKLLG